MDNDTPANEAETGATPISELLGADRHQAQTTHEGHREVGDAPQSDAAPALQPEPKPAPAPAPAPAAAPAAQAEPDPANDPRAPKWYRDHMAKVNRELAEHRARAAQPAPAPAPTPRPAPELPNPAEDPQGYAEAIQRNFGNQMQQFQLQTTLTLSERFARQQHGNDTFEDCRSWLSTRPDLEAYFLQQPDPWGAAFSHFNREKLVEEIGEDPAAYRARVEKEIREKLEAEFAGRTTPQPAAAPQMRSAPPAPASQVRSAQPRDDRGQFAGPTPLAGALKHGSIR